MALVSGFKDSRGLGHICRLLLAPFVVPIPDELHPGFRGSDLELKVKVVGIRVQGFRVRVWGFGFGIRDSGQVFWA